MAEKIASRDHLRAEVQKEINQGKVRIDRSVFQKSDFDRKTLKMLKKDWKNSPQSQFTTIRSK